MSPRRPKSGAAPITPDAITTAAIELADAAGLQAVSMRSVGRRLGVEGMALYNHVAGKQALLDVMVDRVFAEISCPTIEGPWQQEIRGRHHSARNALRRHRWAIGLMNSRRTPGIETLRHHDALLGCLRHAGMSLALTAHAVAVIDAHLYGFMVQELSLPFEGQADLTPVAEPILAALPANMPHFRDFTLLHALQPGYRFDAEFDVGLQLVLDGLQRWLDAEGHTPWPPLESGRIGNLPDRSQSRRCSP